MARTRHLLLRAPAGEAPFELPAAVEAATGALRDAAARTASVVLAFALLPAELDLLVAVADEGDGPDFVATLRRGLATRVNRLLGRRGAVVGEAETVAIVEPDAEWVPLAEAIEGRVAAERDGVEPGDCLACSAHPDHAEWVRAVATPVRRRAAPVATPPATTIGEVVGVGDVPTVVQLPRVVELADALQAKGEPDEAVLDRLREYVAGWYLSDRRALRVARAVLAGLGQADSGGGYFVTGLYGAGKSHLLAVAMLVVESATARRELSRAQAELADLVPDLDARGDRLVVPVALDEQPPTVALEDAVFAAAEAMLRRRCRVEAPLAEVSYVADVVRRHVLPQHGAELDAAAGGSWELLQARDPEEAAGLARRFVESLGLPLTFAQSRVERLGRLLELARGAGRGGVVFVLDELSVFLSARDRRGLHGDAGFLQFLGQRTQLSPVWVVAALQKQIEDVGEVEHYTLRQIKDRFETRLSLPLTAAREVLRRKVVRPRSEAALNEAAETAARAWSGGRRSADLSVGAVRESYPLHPLTFSCLEACAERFLAKTRSLIEFAAARVGGDELSPGVLDRPTTALVTPDELWDHFARDLAHHPDLVRYREGVVDYYEHNLPALLEGDDPLALRLVKLLVVLRLSGLERGVKDLAAALEPAREGREEHVAVLLEAFRGRGAYVAVQRHSGPFNDVFSVDLDYDVNETIRRRARSVASTLTAGDARLTAVAAEACRGDELPLATCLHPHATQVAWRNTNRGIFVALRDLRSLSPQEMENQAALLAGRESVESVYLYLAEPQGVERQREAFGTGLQSVADERWRHSLVAWLPREATGEERQAWVEDVALELVRYDPTLAAGGPAQALRERLDEDSEVRLERLAGLLRRLYFEGCLMSAAGEVEAPAGAWREALVQAVGPALDTLFPRFAAVAPRRHVVSRAVANDLIRDFVVPGEATVSAVSVLAAAIEDYAIPLGIAQGENGEYRVRIASGGLAERLLDVLPARPVTPAEVEAYLAKSPSGLVPELTQLLLAAMIRRGHLSALDETGARAELGAPLHACVARVEPAPLVNAQVWERLQPVAEVIFGGSPRSLSGGTQQALFERLARWHEAALAHAGASREAIAATIQALGHEPLQWREAEALVERVEALASGVEPGLLAADGLARFAAAAEAYPPDELAATLQGFARLRAFAETGRAALVQAARDLGAAPLPSGSPLAAEREALLLRLASGEKVAFGREALLADLDDWRRSYAQTYAAWHAEVHAAEVYEPYDALRVGPLMRALANLSRLAVDVPDSANAVQEALRAERAKQCRRADLTLALRERLVCPQCHLNLGERPSLRPASELEGQARAAVEELLGQLRRPQRRELIERGIADLAGDDPRVGHVRKLLDGTELAPEELLLAGGFAVIDLINTVLTHRVVGRRSLAELTDKLSGKRLTRRQLTDAFETWVDPQNALHDDDLLEID